LPQSGSVRTHREILDNRIRKQFRRDLLHLLNYAFVGLTSNIELESLALPNRADLLETESVTCACDCFTLRVVDFRLEHYIDHDSGHDGRLPRALLRTAARPAGICRLAPFRDLRHHGS
jgi:hypothetical protein